MALDPSEIRAELDRILAAGAFKRSARLSRFLRFTVESTLEKRQELIKEYVLGVQVYEKGTDFDPRIDSTVRVEAARLRAKLREYYETEGCDDFVRIEFPKGAYTPVFRRVDAPASPVAGGFPAGAIWTAGLLLVAGITGGLLYQWPPRPTVASTFVKPLTAWPGREIQACFSPDGRHVAMAWSAENDDNFDIYVKPVGDGPHVRLTSDPAPDLSPAWSPDGRAIAFVRESPGTGVGVYLVPAHGGAERLVARLRRSETYPAARILDWLADGETVVVSDKNSADEPLSLFRISVETGERQRLTDPLPQWYGDLQPAVSPDGKTSAFVRSLSHPGGEVYVVPLGGGEPRQLTFESNVITGMAWSADGKSIVFSSERRATAGAGGLWRIAVSGSSSHPRLEQVHGIGARATWPAIARNGELLAYQEIIQNSNVWRVPTNGRGEPTVLIASTREQVQPDYSRDGSRIAFRSNRSGNWEIWLANMDGSQPRQVTAYAGEPAGSPRWSPDGRLIAFEHFEKGNVDVYTTTPEGKPIRRLTAETSRDEAPSWSGDGRFLYFNSNRSGATEVWRMALDQPAQVIRLTNGGGAFAEESADGKYLYFQRGSARTAEIWRMTVNGGEPARVFGPPIGWWTLHKTGLYFVDSTQGIADYNFTSGRTTPVIPLERNSAVRGLTVSPDGRWLLYGKIDRTSSDIMLVENFR